MSKPKKIIVTILASLAGLIVVLFIAAIIILQSGWFSNFVRNKIVATLEDSTGGKVEIGAFQFDLGHLTLRIRNFVFHGTEPSEAQPLAQVPLLEVHLGLFSGIMHLINIQDVAIEQPQVNIITFPDGKSNIPTPKTKQQQSSQSSGLKTVVDLKIGHFHLDNGLFQFSQQKTAFSAKGENLRALLNYVANNPHYEGSLSIDPLVLTSGTRPPLNVHINLPVMIAPDAVDLTNARITTNESHIFVNASISNMNAPQIAARMNAAISLPEIQRSMDVPVDSTAKGAPRVLTANLAVQMNEGAHTVNVQTAHIALGQTTFDASGALNPGTNSAVRFNGTLALQQLSALLKMTSTQPSGELVLNGSARLDAKNNYSVNGVLNSRNLAVRSGTTELANLNLHAPFHADPYLIGVDGLQLSALGGTLDAKLFIENMQRLSVEGALRNFSLPVLAATFTGKHLGYDGTIDGTLKAAGDLKIPGGKGINAHTRLAIVPGTRGVPIRGQLMADYVGATGAVNLGQSYLALPHSRLNLSGSLDRRIDINLLSRNLNDFLPAANFASTTPQSSLPVTLENGTARLDAQITGKLAAPQVTSHLDLDRFAVEKRLFDRFALDLAASPSGAAIQNGVLSRKTLRTNFDASLGLRKWSPTPRSPLAANLTLRNGDLADLLSLAGESTIPASGDVSADIHVNGTYGDPAGSATLQVLNGSAYQQPIDKLYANVNLADQLVTLSTLELDSAGGQIALNGTFRHPRDSFTTGHAQFHIGTSNVQLANIKPLVERSPGVAGAIQLSADAAADVREVNKQSSVSISNVSADFSARGLRVQNQNAGDMTATARTVNGAVNYQLASNFAGSNINVNGRTALSKDYPTTANASIGNLSIGKVLQITGQAAIPADGILSANAHFTGTMQAPNADLSFALRRANVYQETINHLQGSLRYSNTLVDIPSIELALPAGSVTLVGSFAHPANDFNNGAVNLNLTSTDIHLARIEHVRAMHEGIGGTVHLATAVAARIGEQRGKRTVAISTLNADLSAKALRMNERDLGNAGFTAHTTGSTLNFRLDSDIANAQIHGSGQSQLTGEYPVRASLTFANIRYSNIEPFLSSTPPTAPAFDALVEGQASVNGPILNADALTARLQLNRLDLKTNPAETPTGAPPARTVELQNQGPIVVALDRQVLRVEHLNIQGDGTTITASGGLNLKNPNTPLALNLAADANLSILQDADRDFYSSGDVALNATVRGNLSKPLVNGEIQLKNANINYAGAPNGLSNGNGVILLNGSSATIQSLTGESGGGKIAMTGFVGFGGPVMNYNLRAAATKVRVRTSGISITTNANISLAGNTNRSLLQGNVSIQRIAYEAGSDAGSMLSSFASTPPSTPSAPSKMLTGMRLDIHVLTAPDLRVVTTYAERLSVQANLTVRGTAANPGILGSVNITEGDLVFFGNKYTVRTGTINFYNPTSIQPVINISLETIAQGVDVTLGVSGPMNDLKLTYRSDPPLTFQQIVELLAANTTPPNPEIAANQPAPPQQSFTQMGESAILGQAVANPLASRLQRVFGLTQFKIDPMISGPNGQPGARVTLQQKIASNITFTYITDVTQSNNEIIRVEWDLTNKFSAVGLRDYNGNVSIEFFYKFKKR
ncbi:MAG TPA: translocation/assembly module TamB domain-containing protein [Bryobacteraceae bacterium]|nr:translocation/assembly module TamB domain-containing protein [Bryobacteraceae bacterium]